MGPDNRKINQRINTALGNVLRELRESKTDLSQEKFAFHAEIDRTHYGKIERGHASASVVMLFRISKLLGVSCGKILSEVDKNLTKKK